MSNKQNTLGIRVRDIVEFNCTRTVSRHAPIFSARVLEINQNRIGGLIVRYERLDGVVEKYPSCHISLVARIIERAPYVVMPRKRVNIFALHPTIVSRAGGYRVGSLHELICHALQSAGHIDLPYWLHQERMKALFEKAKRPGQVGSFYWGIEVRWKTFRRWVHRNAARLIETPAEHAAVEYERHQHTKGQYEADMEADMRIYDEMCADEDLYHSHVTDMEQEVAHWL